MKTLLLVFLLSIAGSGAIGQTWTAGPKIVFGLSTTAQGDELRVGPHALRLTTTTISSPTQFGGFVRYDRAHWYGQAEGLFGKFGTGFVRSAASLGSGADGLRAQRADVRLLAGVKPMPWLRLHAGAGYARLNWSVPDYAARISFAEQTALERPEAAQTWLARADFARFSQAVDQSYRRNVLTGQAGLGIDIYGFMIDLVYSQSITPLIKDISINNNVYTARQHYRNFALSIGYRLLPVKPFLTASRKSNRAYQRIKRDIPFYRNEFHTLVGATTDDFGRAFLYENRYTRYLTRRVGITGGLLLSREFAGRDNDGGLPGVRTAYSITTGIRVLPLYSRHHTIGIAAGPILTYEQGAGASSGRQFEDDGQLVTTINLRDDSAYSRVVLGWQTILDYHVAITDRLIAGPWLRVFGETVAPDYASLGIQAGYRF